MSNVTSVFVLIGDSEDGFAEDVAPKVAEAITEFIPEVGALPVISTGRDGWERLQGGNKPGGGAAIWFAWNYARPHELEEHLQAKGFENITVWSQEELYRFAPRVTSW